MKFWLPIFGTHAAAMKTVFVLFFSSCAWPTTHARLLLRHFSQVFSAKCCSWPFNRCSFFCMRSLDCAQSWAKFDTQCKIGGVKFATQISAIAKLGSKLIPTIPPMPIFLFQIHLVCFLKSRKAMIVVAIKTGDQHLWHPARSRLSVSRSVLCVPLVLKLAPLFFSRRDAPRGECICPFTRDKGGVLYGM